MWYIIIYMIYNLIIIYMIYNLYLKSGKRDHFWWMILKFWLYLLKMGSHSFKVNGLIWFLKNHILERFSLLWNLFLQRLQKIHPNLRTCIKLWDFYNQTKKLPNCFRYFSSMPRHAWRKRSSSKLYPLFILGGKIIMG